MDRQFIHESSTLLDNDVAVYAAHLPLDKHPVYGNNVLLARELGLCPSGEFAQYKTIAIGVHGETDLDNDLCCFILAGAGVRSTPWW